jgi:methyl-accepting chemotaxis protein I, serine sensor receptor
MLFARLHLHLRLPGSLLSAVAWPGLREFFAYHGVWAPGVRLLRMLTVRAKVLTVMGLLALPLLPLSGFVVRQVNDTVQTIDSKLAALGLSEATTEFRAGINRQKLADEGQKVPPGPGLQQSYQAIVVAYQKALLAEVALQSNWERLRPDMEKATQAERLSPEQRSAVLDRAYEASVALSRASVLRVTSESEDGLRLSQQAALALDLVPSLQQALYRARELVRQQGRVEPRPVDAERHAAAIQLASALAEVRSQARRVSEHLGLLHSGGQAGPDPLAQVENYLRMVETQLLAWDGVPNRDQRQATYALAREDVRKLRSALTDEVAAAYRAQKAQAERMRALVVGALGGVLALAAYLLYCFFLVMRGGLVQLNHQMNRMAQGDLSARLHPLGVDEVATTMHAMTAALVRLSDLMAAVRHGVGAVTQATQQVALGNADLSTRHHEAARQIDAAVDGVQRYAQQLEACGRQVEAVVGTVQALRLESARNRKQMHRLRERMASLRGKSREIGEIVSLIDQIAFRTNILALNASVEASKAGETGRGFAVVAQEVRSLAQRGAESARRIGDIVSRSAEDIELSSALAEETGQALAAVDAHVDHIHQAMDEVAGRTRGGEQESAAILSQLTQIKDGSDLGLRQVEQLATASDALRTQGERLAHKIGQFKLS